MDGVVDGVVDEVVGGVVEGGVVEGGGEVVPEVAVFLGGSVETPDAGVDFAPSAGVGTCEVPSLLSGI